MASTWQTYRSPVLRRGAIPELADVVYRATFAYDPQRDLVSLWHSGARSTQRGYEWHAAFERRPRADLFAAVGRAGRRVRHAVERATAHERDGTVTRHRGRRRPDYCPSKLVRYIR